MRRVLLAEAAILAELQFFWSVLLVLGSRIVPLLALGAGEGHDITHGVVPQKLSPAGRGTALSLGKPITR